MPRLPDGVWHRRCLTPVSLGQHVPLAAGLLGSGTLRVPDPYYPTHAPPFWSIAWPVTPRASGERSHATVPAISSG